ncbi:anti-phage ZorAB system protein ZorA [Methylobacterium sp. A52T]
MRPVVWTPLVRFPLFWGLFVIGYTGSYFLPVLSSRSNLALVGAVGGEIGRGDFANVGHPEFAFALACAIVSTAVGLAFASLIAHVLAIRISLRLARKQFGADAPDEKAFLANFDRINQRLSRHGLVGHAWQEFAKTCMRDQVVIRTMRPASFFGPSVVRERLMGMKLMPTVPGYFVGLGLLLTFVGLVIALSKAAAGVAGSPEGMTQSLRELLDAATFKFSTSIAGLFSSLFLALVFKVYSIIIETGFDRFCHRIEDRTHFLAPQYVLTQLAASNREQVEQLKNINDAQFFDRLGQVIGPALEAAVGRAVTPLADQLQATVGKLEDNSRTGTEGLMNKFMDALHGGAGNELKDLSATLAQTKDALGAVKSDLAGSGQDFARRMSEATERLAGLISDAGNQFQANNQASRETIESLLRSLAVSADATRERLDRDMAEAGRMATTAVRDSMTGMLDQVERQMGSFRETVAAIQDQIGREAEAAAARSREATAQTVAAAGKAAAETAQAIKSGFTETVEKFGADVDRMSAALRSSEQAFASQTAAARETVDRTNEASVAFGRVASDVTAASTPLLQASERIAVSTRAMEEATRGAVEGLRLGQDAAKSLADRLEQGHQAVETAWRSYEERFGTVDQALSDAVRALASETAKQQESIASFAVKIDEGCSLAVQRLQAIAGSLAENTDDLSETFDTFLARVQKMAAEDA